MTDERIRNLVNASIDGALTDDERTELDRELAGSPQTREYLAAMQALDSFLKAQPMQDPPEGLHERIVESVVLPSPSRREADGWTSVWRYGLAAAAGVLLTVGVYESGPDQTWNQDVAQMVGAMAPMAGPELDRYTINEPGLRSSARLEQRDDALVLDVMLDSEEAVDVTIELSASGLEVDGLAKMRSQFESLVLADGAIRTRSRGQQRFSALLRRADRHRADAESVVKIAFSRDGTLLNQGALRPE